MVVPGFPPEDTSSTHAVLSIREDIEQRLAQLLPETGPEQDLIAYAMRESTLAPGKRIRPVLLVLAARELGCASPALLDLGCAVEMVHAASLVLDDMPCMDDAKLRRGRPTLHLVVGEDVAILAAIALLSRAFGLVARLPDIDAGVCARLVGQLADAVGMHGLAKGQLQDLRDGSAPRSAQAISATNDLKTGVLFGATLEMAAIVAQADDAARASLRCFASELGQAFQLLDDLQDIARPDAPDTGKDCGKDDGKSTLIALLGAEDAKRRLDSHLLTAEAHLTEVYGGRPTMCGFMRSLFATPRQVREPAPVA